jgi:hypothetical protein
MLALPHRSSQPSPKLRPACVHKQNQVKNLFYQRPETVTHLGFPCILLANLACGTPAMVRGGPMHGMGGFGIHEGHGMGAGEGVLTPTYVLITVLKITDAEAFKGALRDLMGADTSFGGRPWTPTNR